MPNDHPVTANDFARFRSASHGRVGGLGGASDASRTPQMFERDAAGLRRRDKQFAAHHKLIGAAPRNVSRVAVYGGGRAQLRSRWFRYHLNASRSSG